MGQKPLTVIVRELDENERNELLIKFQEVLAVDNLEQIHDATDFTDEQEFVRNYKLGFFDYIALFFGALFGGLSLKNYVYKKELGKLVMKYSLSEPPIVDLSGKKVYGYFFQHLFQIAFYLAKYKEMLGWYQRQFGKIDTISDIALYLFETQGSDNVKKLLSLFTPEHIQQIMLTEKNHKKYFNDLLASVKKEVKPHLAACDVLVNRLYNFSLFASFDFERMFRFFFPAIPTEHLFEGNEGDTLFPISRLQDYIFSLYRCTVVYPFVIEFDEKLLRFMAEYYTKKTGKQVLVDDWCDNMNEVNKTVLFVISRDFIPSIYKLMLQDPLKELPACKVDLHLGKRLENVVSEKLTEMLANGERDIRQQKMAQIDLFIMKEELVITELKDLNIDFNTLLETTGLRQLEELKVFNFFNGFYQHIWKSRIKGNIEHLLEFKYYLFPSETARHFRTDLDEFELFEEARETLDQDVARFKMGLMKEKGSIGPEQKLKIDIEISGIDMKIREALRTYFQHLLKIEGYLEYNKNDGEVRKLYDAVVKYTVMFKLVID